MDVPVVGGPLPPPPPPSPNAGGGGGGRGPEVTNNRPGLRVAVAALGFRDFRLFYLALLAATLGSQVQATANLYQIYELTGSPLHLGLTGLARAIPILGLSLVGGVIADRVDRRLFIMFTQAATGV